MPYLSASAADLKRAHGIVDDDCPDAAVIIGVLSMSRYGAYLQELWPTAREVLERVWLVELNGRRIWFVATFGAAMAATYAHLAATLGAQALIQLGMMGGLEAGREVGSVLVPELVIGRDGVSRQLSRNRPIKPDAALATALAEAIRRDGQDVFRGTLVTTTTIAFERPSDIARWRRAGFAGVEMEAAATHAVADHFGVPAASALVLLDNLVVSHTVFSLSDVERARTREARRSMERVTPAVLGECLSW